jgi:hypothetical protein
MISFDFKSYFRRFLNTLSANLSVPHVKEENSSAASASCEEDRKKIDLIVCVSLERKLKEETKVVSQQRLPKLIYKGQ